MVLILKGSILAVEVARPIKIINVKTFSSAALRVAQNRFRKDSGQHQVKSLR